MALKFAHGAVQWLTTDVLNSTKVVSGLGFQPKALRFYWVGLQSNSPTNAASEVVSMRRGIGFAVSSTSRRSIGSFNLENSASSDCGVVAADNSVVITVDNNGTVDGRLDISSIDTGGFTLIVDDVTPANITVFYEAWGGNDITVAEIGDIAEPGATGTVNYTVNGFTSDGIGQCVMFAGCQSTAALNTGAATDSGICVGFATSTDTTNNVTICGNSDDASAQMDTDGYCVTSECLSMIVIAGGNTSARATLSAWGTNLFTLDWLQRGTTNRRYFYMAIKGGRWQAGGTTIAGNTLNSTTSITSLPFAPIGISMFTANEAENAIGSSSTNDRICIGTGISTTSRNSAGVLDENLTANVEIDLVIQYDSILSVPSTAGGVQAEYDVSNVFVNGFTIITDVAGGLASTFLGYLTFGSARTPQPQTIGHPFII